MAVVAFPFSTCFTSEDIEELDSLQKPYDLCSQDDNEQKPDGTLIDGDGCDRDAAVALVSSLVVGEKTIPSNPSEETRPMTDEDLIDNLFEEALKDDNGSDDGDSHVVDNVTDNTHQQLKTQLATATADIDSAEQEAESIEPDSVTVNKYGGLINLGNTCYMASALQMVASLDGFTHELEKVAPPGATHEDDDQPDDSRERKPSLRRTFLDVMASLKKGETPRPIEFKQALDERTPLFLGYRQEDSHEFLTTLFDLLDADYKTKKEEENKTEEDVEELSDAKQEEDEGNSNRNNNCNNLSSGEEVENVPDNCEMIITYQPQEEEKSRLDDFDGEKASTAVETSVDEDIMVLDEQNAEEVDENKPSTAVKSSDVSIVSVDQECSESFVSALKRPRNEETDEESQHEGINKLREARVRGACQSFSNLQPEGIEELLNARLLVNSTQEPAMTPSPPRCKLAGGRMPASETNGTVLFCDSDTSILSPSLDTPQQEQDSSASVPTPLSPVESYLQTEVRVRLTCQSCSYTRSHLENFLHLSLEIGTDDENMSGNVADGLRKFFAPERREIKCEKCFHDHATQTMEITKLPRALLLHFKRFIVDISDDYTSITYRKNQSEVMFDSSLKYDGVLSEFVADGFSSPHEIKDDTDFSYNIRAVVNHIGSSAACGHYTCAAYRDYGGERRWNRFNDSYVSDIASEEAISNATRTAYMVMYELSPEVEVP